MFILDNKRFIMKTNIILNSPDRELFGVVIRQQTKSGFLNLSDLQEAYLRARVLNGWSDKRVDHILSFDDNMERIYFLLKERGILMDVCLTTFIENAKKEGFIRYLKKLNVYQAKGARKNRTTWCDPYIWVLVAMELNPMLYAKVVIYLTDKLIINRIEAGNFYKGLTQAITKFQNVDYVKLAKALNYKVFGRHETGIRNLATKEELKKLYELESKIAFAVDMGYITNFEDCLKAISKTNQ